MEAERASQWGKLCTAGEMVLCCLGRVDGTSTFRRGALYLLPFVVSGEELVVCKLNPAPKYYCCPEASSKKREQCEKPPRVSSFHPVSGRSGRGHASESSESGVEQLRSSLRGRTHCEHQPRRQAPLLLLRFARGENPSLRRRLRAPPLHPRSDAARERLHQGREWLSEPKRRCSGCWRSCLRARRRWMRTGG